MFRWIRPEKVLRDLKFRRWMERTWAMQNVSKGSLEIFGVETIYRVFTMTGVLSDGHLQWTLTTKL